jgi:hypothetical protein
MLNIHGERVSGRAIATFLMQNTTQHDELLVMLSEDGTASLMVWGQKVALNVPVFTGMPKFSASADAPEVLYETPGRRRGMLAEFTTVRPDATPDVPNETVFGG